MAHLSLSVILIVLYICPITTAAYSIATFKTCQTGFVFNGTELGSFVFKSEMDCARWCEEDLDCNAMNVCPVNQNGQTKGNKVHSAKSDSARRCSVFGEHNDGHCDALEQAADCYFMQKICMNGGTPQLNGQCLCPVQYSGPYCERYIRDCTEAYRENGYQTSTLNGFYLIQPLNAPRPFTVYCYFQWGGVTAPLARAYSGWQGSNINWTTAVEGFADAGMNNYFIGLQNMHYFTNQASYTFDFNLHGSPQKAKFYYSGLKVGSEAQRFALTYSNFWPSSSYPNSENGLDTTSAPLQFATADNDPAGCVASVGYPGWYGGDCSQYSFFADPLLWPVGGVDETKTAITLVVSRDGDLY